jgi:hypothetical protein
MKSIYTGFCNQCRERCVLLKRGTIKDRKMEKFLRKKGSYDNDEYSVRMDDGAEIIPVVAGLLVSVVGFGILGYRIAGNIGAVAGVITGAIVGVAFNNFMAIVAKWGSLIALAGLAVYGTIASIM